MDNNNQELKALYSELIERMKMGVEMHENLADYYGFLNLPGYQKCHEYHMLCELLAYRKAKHEYMKEFHQLVPPAQMMYNTMTNMANNNSNSNMSNNNMAANNGNNTNHSVMAFNNVSNMNSNSNPIIPQNWYNYTRYDVDAGTKRSAVKEGYKRWLDYEKATKEFFTEMLTRLEKSGQRSFIRKIEFLLDEVEKEIAQGEEKMLELENTGYDMNFIIQQQEGLKEKYARKIKELNMKDYHYRAPGQGNYANYTFEDDDDDDDDDYARSGRSGRGNGRVRS